MFLPNVNWVRRTRVRSQISKMSLHGAGSGEDDGKVGAGVNSLDKVGLGVFCPVGGPCRENRGQCELSCTAEIR